MANIHIKRKHNLACGEAKVKIEQLAKDLKDKVGVSYRWDGDCLCFDRKGASGFIDVQDGLVEVDIKLGMLLKPMKSKIENSINEGFDVALAESGDSRVV